MILNPRSRGRIASVSPNPRPRLVAITSTPERDSHSRYALAAPPSAADARGGDSRHHPQVNTQYEAKTLLKRSGSGLASTGRA
jgi:hypothetical protein